MKVNIKYPKSKCAYCGKEYTKTHNRQTYCSDKCRKHARQEKRRIYDSQYYYRNRKRIHQRRKGTPTIGPTPNPNVEREAEIVRKEVERIGLHIF